MSHNREHRPLWPEYYQKKPTLRNLFGLYKHQAFDENGVTELVSNWESLTSFMVRENAMVFVKDLSDTSQFLFLFDAVKDEKSRVICDSWGKPRCIRVKRGRKTYWLIESSKWSDDDLDVDFLKNMWDTFLYFGVGMCTSPASLGSKLMCKFHHQYKMKYHTSPSLYCEEFIRSHNVGGMAQALGQGNQYDEALLMDESAAYLAFYCVHPDKGATFFRNGNYGNCFTYFARCTVTILEDLPMGIFPVRVNSRRLSYPVKKGEYETYLWKEHADFIESQGVKVRVHEGYYWRAFTTDNELWAQEMYKFRYSVPNSFIERAAKKSAVAAMGCHSIDRKLFYLVDEEHASISAKCIPNSKGEPLALFIEEEYNANKPVMIHWWSYTQDECNLSVLDFALPFAKQGRLIDIDFDSILVLDEGGETRESHISREHMRAYDVPPGTWLWELLHDVRILAPRSYTSVEKTKTPGIRRVRHAG